MGEGNGVASVIMLTFTKRPGPRGGCWLPSPIKTSLSMAVLQKHHFFQLYELLNAPFALNRA